MASVIHQPERNRYAVEQDGFEGELIYEERDGELVLTHTAVPAEIQNRGLASELVASAIERAKREGLRVVPVCSYVQVWLRRHPEQTKGLLVRLP